MGVFGEKHTSLTREQKRQLIHQADTHKLRPTEVCDWVLATWGLRIARVTVYSILHKQRASLMAGHKDLYQSMQNSVQALQQASSANASSSSSSTNPYSTTEDACLERDPTTGRINKYHTTAAGKRARNTSSSARSSSMMPDFSSMPPVPSGEGARWEGQLKRVREPASVELDRAMVQFLKSSAAVDEHGRRLNDAELQSHALRLARGIPSASRMRCSFGWLRHFKRRLGVQWAADRLGRHRWIVEMDPFGSSTSTAPSETALPPLTSASSTSPLSTTNTQTSADVSQTLVGPSSALNRSRRQGKVAKHEHGIQLSPSLSQPHATPDQLLNNGSSSNEDNDDDDDDEEEYHSSHELLGKEHDFTSPIPATINNHFLSTTSSVKHTRSASTSTSASTTSASTAVTAAYNNGSTLRHHAQTLSNLDLHQQHQQQQQHRLYSFGSESSPFSSLGQFPSLHPTLASHSGLLNSYSSSLPSTTTPTTTTTPHHTHPTQQPHSHAHTSSILDSFPNLFDSLPPLHSPSSSIPISSSQLFLNHTSASIDTANKTPSATTTSSRMDVSANNPFGMSVDGGMRKVPSKDEAYDMLQSLLLYYEQDHHYIGEQQTLLLPRWIHQQRQIMSQSDESDPRLLWMRNTVTASSTPSLSSSTSSPAPHPLSAQSLSHPHSNFSQNHHTNYSTHSSNNYHHNLASQQQQQYPRALSHTSSSPPMSPLSTASTSDPAGLEHFQLNSSDPSSSIPVTSTSATTPTTASVGTSSFPSLTSSLEQQMFFAHQHALQQQFALHQQQQQQRQQQQQQQQQHSSVLSHQ